MTGARVVSWPTREEVWDYCKELSSTVDPGKFFDYYEQRKWQTASGPVYDWKALFRCWDRTEFRKVAKKATFSHKFGDDPVSADSIADFMRS